MTTRVFNSIYSKRGLPFRVEDYPSEVQRVLREKLLPVEEIVRRFPRKFSFFAALALGQPRGLLRSLSLRDDWEDVRYLSALLIEAYAILEHPAVTLASGYLSPVDRFIHGKMKKTVTHLPQNFCQFGEYIMADGKTDYWLITVTPPDENGFVNVGPACDVNWEGIEHYQENGKARIIFEINSHLPWVQGHPDYNGNRFHISIADSICEFHEPLPEIAPIEPTEVERAIANRVLPYIQDGDTIQFGIGGVPNYVASQLRTRRQLKIHSEMLTDAVVDLYEAGAIDSTGRDYMDGYIVGTFAAGTSRLYDFLDRNPLVMMLPVKATNLPTVVAKNKRMKSVNSSLMVDFNGQVASDAISSTQISGIGGQLEFVMGAQLSPGGRSILCLKSTTRLGGKVTSNVVSSLPPGTPVSVQRQFADVIITEHGAAELRHLDNLERTNALIAIAHPKFQQQLKAEARKAGLLERRPGFTKFIHRAMFHNLVFLRKLTAEIEKKPSNKGAILFRELKKAIASPDLINRTKAFVSQNSERAKPAINP